MRRPLAACICALVTTTAAPAFAQTGSGTIRGTGKVSVRSTPGGTVMGRLRGGRAIAIACQLNGKTANGSGGRSAIWDKIAYGKRTGYVADAVVDTGTTTSLVAGYCGAPGPVTRVDPSATSGACSITSPVALDDPYASHGAFLQAAVPGAQASDRETKVPAAVTLAQAILESGWGQFTAGANNYFGIKAQATSTPGVFAWAGVAVGCTLKKTQEEVGGRMETQIGAFRAYKGLADSIKDHGERLLANPVYANAFKYTDDDKRFATEMGRYYATSSTYASSLIALMDKYDLTRYDVADGGQSAGTGGQPAG